MPDYWRPASNELSGGHELDCESSRRGPGRLLISASAPQPSRRCMSCGLVDRPQLHVEAGSMRMTDEAWRHDAQRCRHVRAPDIRRTARASLAIAAHDRYKARRTSMPAGTAGHVRQRLTSSGETAGAVAGGADTIHRPGGDDLCRERPAHLLRVWLHLDDDGGIRIALEAPREGSERSRPAPETDAGRHHR